MTTVTSDATSAGGERILADMGLAERTAFLSSILESSTEYSIVAEDLDSTVRAWNEGARSLYGYEPAEVVGRASAFILDSPGDAETGRSKAIRGEARATGRWSGELERVRKNGQQFTAFVTITLRRDDADRPAGFTVISRDLTEPQQLLRELREARERNQELIETTSFINNVFDGSTEYSIIAMDLDEVILAWNEGARRNYGYTAGEMVRKQSSRLLHAPEDVASGRVKALLDAALATGKAEGVFARVRKGDSRFTASVAVTLRRDAGGSAVGYVLISKDITAQQAFEEQLRRQNVALQEQNRRVEEANRLKSEFLANMSHELRTPLNGVIGFAELMHDGKVGPVSADHKEYLGDILTSSRHLLQLINDVLDLSKVESGKMEFRPERVEVQKLVGEVRDILRTFTAERRIRLTHELDPAVESLVIDPAKLKQVLYNYLSNALKFTPEGGSVVVRVRPEGESRFRLEVQDTGIGIREEDFGRLFVEFQQLDASPGKKYQGTGLGLALTRRIVEAQGGEVGVTSTVGKGSSFHAILPRVAGGAEPETSAVSAPAVRKLGQRIVLVVEDDPKERAWIRGTLTAAGYAVEAVASGEAAIRAAREQAFDAVTLDLLLPDMSGWDALRAIRASERNRDVAAIVLTVIAEKGAGVGFVIHDFLVKPVPVDELLHALERVRGSGTGERSLLIVDDDPNVAKLVQRALSEHGVVVTVAPDGASGLAAAKASPPSAVLLDLLMPEMDGFEFLRQFRQTDQGSNTPVIIWTVKDLTSAERARLQASAQAIITKGAGSNEALMVELEIHLERAERGAHGR